MGVIAKPDPAKLLQDSIASQLEEQGINPHAVKNMDEQQTYLFLHGLNPHIHRRTVRDAVLRKELRGVRRGNKNLFSRKDALAWMNGDGA